VTRVFAFVILQPAKHFLSIFDFIVACCEAGNITVKISRRYLLGDINKTKRREGRAREGKPIGVKASARTALPKPPAQNREQHP